MKFSSIFYLRNFRLFAYHLPNSGLAQQVLIIMDFLWILVAFLSGFAVKQLDLPPLIGYLAAGFALHAFGFEPLASIEVLSELGITLLLFTIGLKLRVRDLASPDIFGTASAHMLLWASFIALLMLLVSVFTSKLLFDLNWQIAMLIGFTLSFSSTVCVVKVLEEKSELKTDHGKVSIGILVLQDVAAVVFLVLATGKVPSVWAFALLFLLIIRPLLGQLLRRSGHGELLILAGFFFALGGAEIFHLTNVKGDLGALVMGMLLATEAKSAELYKSLMDLKDIFLIGFFLSIGFAGLPTWDTLALALGLTALLPLKFMLFFSLFIYFKLSARTAFLGSLALMNFSEFGLIVASMGVTKGWLSNEWLVAIALSVALSFIISSYLYKNAHSLYSRYQKKILSREPDEVKEKKYADLPLTAEILVIGMGRVGKGAHASLREEFGNSVWGVEADSSRVNFLRSEGNQTILADAQDIGLWKKMNLGKLKLIMLALPSVDDMKSIIDQLKQAGFQGSIVAIAQFEDDKRDLLAQGATSVFNYYEEVGAGFAYEGSQILELGEKGLVDSHPS